MGRAVESKPALLLCNVSFRRNRKLTCFRLSNRIKAVYVRAVTVMGQIFYRRSKNALDSVLFSIRNFVFSFGKIIL